MSTILSSKPIFGNKLKSGLSLKTRPSLQVVNSSKKVDISKQGLNTVDDDVVRNNLQGTSRYMRNKDWIDAQGRKGKGYGVYRFSDKYGSNVDGYSPIYQPDFRADSGNTYTLGTKGLLAWLGLVVILLGVGINLIVSTSQLGS